MSTETNFEERWPELFANLTPAQHEQAVSAGWSADELRKIGFAEPDKKARTRKRAPRKNTAQTPTRTPAVSTTASGLESDFKLSDDAASPQPAGV